MQRIKMTVPAPLTNLGTGINGLALAIQLTSTVEFRPREDTDLHLEASGVDADAFTTLEHPSVLAAARVFQHLERTIPGMTIHINNGIPVNQGLGAQAALAVAGVLGAANLLNVQFSRDQLLAFAALSSKDPAGVAAVMLGGLTAAMLDGDTLIYKQLAPVQTRVVIVLPEIKRYQRKVERATSGKVTIEDATRNLTRLPLLIESLRNMDFSTLSTLMQDSVYTPNLAKHITAYDDVIHAAKQAGAAAVSIAGSGPALVAFAENDPHAVAQAMRSTFAAADVPAQTWVLPVDRQGVVVSMTQSAK